MNIYLRALEIGSEQLTEGVKYKYIKQQIEDEFNFTFSPNGESNFIIWFYDNFNDGKSITGKIRSDRNFLAHLLISLRNPDSKRPNHITSRSYIKHLYENTFYVNGIGNKQYVEYKELKEARESSKKALKY